MGRLDSGMSTCVGALVGQSISWQLMGKYGGAGMELYSAVDICVCQK